MTRALVRLAVLAVLAVFAGAPLAAQESRPNVLLLVADDLEPAHLGFVGGPPASTPTIDALAAAGVVLPALWAQPVCRPALATLLTGRWPHETGIRCNDAPAPLAREGVLPALLRARGYATYCGGKFWEGKPPDYGFDAPAETDPRFARGRDDCQDDLFRFLTEHGDEPWFVWWAPSLPHTPHRPPVRFAKAFATAEIPIPAGYDGDRDALVAAERASLAMHAWLDAEVRRLLAFLDERGERESTVVLFVGDNGWSTHRLSKGTPREQGIASPLVVVPPGAEHGRVVGDFLADLVDVHATVLDYAGVPLPEGCRGRSLRPLVEGGAAPPRERLFGAAYTRLGEPYALYTRDARWKYVLYVRDVNSQELSPGPRLARPLHRKAGAQELFDLAADPTEDANLAHEEGRSEQLDALRAACLAWWHDTGGGELPHAR